MKKYIIKLTHWPRPQTCTSSYISFSWLLTNMMQGNNSNSRYCGKKCHYLSFCLIHDKRYHGSCESNITSAVYVTNSMSLNVILYNSSVNKKLYFKHNIGCFCSILPMKILPTKPLQNCCASVRNSFWTNRVNRWFKERAVYLKCHYYAFLNITFHAVCVM